MYVCNLSVKAFCWVKFWAVLTNNLPACHLKRQHVGDPPNNYLEGACAGWRADRTKEEGLVVSGCQEVDDRHQIQAQIISSNGRFCGGYYGANRNIACMLCKHFHFTRQHKFVRGKSI